MTEEDKEAMKMGLTCIKCNSVLFSISKLIQHKKECDSRYFKQGNGDLTMFIKLFTEHEV